MTDACVIIVGDGMADEPVASLGGLTPLEYADTPNMDAVARNGCCRMVRTIPPGLEAGSDIANLSILGYDPRSCYTGRGPLEAASMGVILTEDAVAYRCNLVTVRDGVMEDFSAGHIPSEEGAALLASLAGELPEVLIRSGVSYRNLLVVPHGRGSVTVPPHDIVGQPVGPHLPKDGDAPLLLRCMERAGQLFPEHPVNRSRAGSGRPPVTGIWPWSGGRKPALGDFSARYGMTGGMISAVDLLNGIARCAGMEVIRVPGATGYLDTDYQAKARYAVDALGRLGFLYLHIEAPDEAGHLGNVEEKVRAIEAVDRVVGTVLDAAPRALAVLPDHPTPVRTKTHSPDPVPCAILGRGRDGAPAFSERAAREAGGRIMDATSLLPFLLSGENGEVKLRGT
jgi:2,3-bisphosphoglycerate-independent phosphoglycerate mutase